MPLVSILIPSYNAAATLPKALGSVMAQTVRDWECVVVDDGSTDSTQQLFATIVDPRFRFLKFDRNRGRGAARRYGLRETRGEYLAMVDADDWIYPRKLERQLAFMERHREVALLSGAMAVTDENDQLAGVARNATGVFAPLRQPKTTIGVAHAPSMIRADLARKTGFDTQLLRSQDFDFLLRIMMRHSYAIQADVCYAYSMLASVGLKALSDSARFGRMALMKHRRGHPVAVARGVATSWAKQVAYPMVYRVGLQRTLLERGLGVPTSTEAAEFRAAQRAVVAAADSLTLTASRPN